VNSILTFEGASGTRYHVYLGQRGPWSFYELRYAVYSHRGTYAGTVTATEVDRWRRGQDGMRPFDPTKVMSPRA
jgi:hypothetical protein